ncbi:MAG: hypothetical protein IH618_14365 [Ignavibacteriaceae bacterium]|nr:hypothetical protein [Ignavibacteriaceae bacterium]
MKIYTLFIIQLFIAFTSISSQDFWERSNGLDSTTIYSMAINSDGHIFVGNGIDGVYRSTDNGVSWSNIGPNLGSYNYSIQEIYINQNDNIIIGISDEFADGGMYRSTDSGNSWTAFGIAEHPVFCMAVNSNGDIFAGTASVGIYRSTDNGNSWMQINVGLTSSNINAITINSNEHIFTGTISGGIFRSTDDGENWDQINNGLTTNYVLSLAINSNGDIFAGTEGDGIYRSTDTGNNWIQINEGLTEGEGYRVRSIAVNSNGDIFAGTFDGVFRSTDNGENWTQVNLGLTNLGVYSLAINLNGDVFAGTYDGVFRTNPSANIKVFLQGPYSATTGTMSTTLNTNGYIPFTQPYSAAPWNYAGTETVAGIPADVVDWVLLEVRSDETTLESRRAAFLMSDGSVVDLDGVSSVKFPGVVPGDYYVAIHHRNHLAVMTSNPVTLSFSPDLYDFSTAQSQAYGSSAMKDVGVGVFGMYTGDGNQDGFVTSTDFNVFNPKFTSAANGYEYTDWNLDGFVTSTDFNFFNPNFTAAKQTFVP